MKKIFFTLSILFLLAKGTMALDTLRVCATFHGPPSGIYVFYNCPPDTVLGWNPTITTFDGDTTYHTSADSYPGREGILNYWCDPPYFTGPPDTSVYVIVACAPAICIVSSDSNNHAVIYVDSSTLYGHTSFSLQRRVTTLAWQTVATFMSSDSLILIDTTVNTATQSFYYLIKSNDFNCNGAGGSTMLLQSNGNNLTWSYGSGIGLRGYYIFKRNGLGSYAVIDSTPNLAYTDVTFQSGDEYYIGAYKDDGCQSNSWRSASTPINVRSNKLKIGVSGITEPEQTLKRYYTEGTTLYVELKKADDISLYDVTGRELMRRHTDNLNLELQPGMYILIVGGKGYKVLIQ